MLNANVVLTLCLFGNVAIFAPDRWRFKMLAALLIVAAFTV